MRACTALAGDTAVLMADGRTGRIADLRVGDEIYGTVREGRYRRFVQTEVLDHWSTDQAGVPGHARGRDRARSRAATTGS